MTADEVNGVDEFDELADDHDWAMSVMDRLIDYAPAGASNLVLPAAEPPPSHPRGGRPARKSGRQSKNLVSEGIACGPRFGKGHEGLPCQDAPSLAKTPRDATGEAAS